MNGGLHKKQITDKNGKITTVWVADKIPEKKEYTKVSVISERNIGKKDSPQIVKDSITTTEKKILLQMLSRGMKAGTVKKKTFVIEKQEGDVIDLNIRTKTRSELLNQDEVINYRVKVKVS